MLILVDFLVVVGLTHLLLLFFVFVYPPKYKCAEDDPGKVELPLTDPTRLLSMRRNIEKLTIEQLGTVFLFGSVVVCVCCLFASVKPSGSAVAVAWKTLTFFFFFFHRISELNFVFLLFRI